MTKLEYLAIALPVALLVIGVGLLGGESAGEGLDRLDWPIPLVIFGMVIAAMPMFFFLPRVQAGFLGRIYGLPWETYIVPRWVVHLLVGAGMGIVAAHFVLGIVIDYRVFWVMGLYMLVFAPMFAGARARLKQHPKDEWEMQLWSWRRLWRYRL